MKLTNWLTSPTAEALGWTLIHALWQGFAIVLVIAVLLHLTRRGRASVRYQLGMSGLLVQGLASAATFGWYYEPRLLATTTAPVVPPHLNIPMAFVSSANESWLATTQTFLTAHLAQVVWLWLIGVGFFGIRLIGGWLYIHQLQRTATLPVPALLSDATARLVQKMNVPVSLQLSARVTGPLVVGILKPVVLWPVGLLAGLSLAEVEAILAHELAHVRRHDYLLNVLQSVVDVLYFFHPALWWLSARVREEREHCCDDLAIDVIGDGRVLARALARVEEWQRDTAEVPPLAMAFASKRQLLLQRVRRMLGVPTRPLVSNASLAGLTLVTLLLVSLSMYAVQTPGPPKPKRQPAPPTQVQTSRRSTTNSRNYGLNVLATGAYAPVVATPSPIVPADPVTPAIDDVIGPVPALADDDTSRLRHVQQQLEVLNKEIQAIMAERQPMIEKLTKEMATLGAQNGAYQKQMAPIVGQINQLAKQQQALAKKLAPLNSEIQRLSRQNTTKAKALVRQKELQAEQLEKEMNAVETQIDKLANRMEQLEPYQHRMEAIADSIERLYEPLNALSERMGDLSEQLAGEAERNAEEAQRQAESALGRLDAADSRLARPARAPRPPRAPHPVRPAHPAHPPRPAIAPMSPPPNVPEPPAPASAPTPVVAPKAAPVPAIAPTPAVSPQPTLAPDAMPAPARAPKTRRAPKQ